MSILLATALLQAAVLPPCSRTVAIPLGHTIDLVTDEPLSSRTHVKGQMVRLKVSKDIRIGDILAVPSETSATGQIAEAQATGGMGTGGKLLIVPLYLKVGDRVVRLSGSTSKERGASAGLVVGMVLITPLFSGRSAAIPAGTAIPAIVAKTAIVSASCP